PPLRQSRSGAEGPDPELRGDRRSRLSRRSSLSAKSFRLRRLGLDVCSATPSRSAHYPWLRVIMPKKMTEEIKKKLRDELNTLEYELAHDIPRELKKAVAMGDLSENAEYHMAKQRQEYLKARVRQLGKRLADLSLINMNNIPKDKVGLGSTVTIFDG